MTNEQMQEHLRGLGLKKTYYPIWEFESKTILLTTKQLATIINGRLKGCEIALGHSDVFRVWTPRAKKAKATATAHSLTVRLWNGEAELQVPAALADTILPEFGAKVKRARTEAQKAAMRAHLAIVRTRKAALMAYSSEPSPIKTRVQAIETPKDG